MAANYLWSQTKGKKLDSSPNQKFKKGTKVMELLNRYLEAVRKNLPRKQQDDVVKELSANIQARIEDMESSRGRPLNDTELEDLLKEYGNPVLLAASYQPRSNFISATFSLFWPIARLILSITAFIYVLVIIQLAVLRRPVLHMLGIGALTLLAELGWMVIAFSLLERFHLLNRWNPRALPPVKRNARPTIAGLIFSAIFCLFGLAAVKLPFLVFGPFFRFAPLWHQLYLPLTLFVVLALWVQGVALFRPQATRLLWFADLLIALAGLVLSSILLGHAQELVVATRAGSDWPHWVWGIAIGNVITIYVGLVIAAICFGIKVLLVLAKEIRQLANSEKPHRLIA
jgi:hypothetical protein